MQYEKWTIRSKDIPSRKRFFQLSSDSETNRTKFLILDIDFRKFLFVLELVFLLFNLISERISWCRNHLHVNEICWNQFLHLSANRTICLIKSQVRIFYSNFQQSDSFTKSSRILSLCHFNYVLILLTLIHWSLCLDSSTFENTIRV